jgi:hypothetical protein
MIAIINRGHVSDDPDDDNRRYIIYINQKPIAGFEHRRADGLAACLRKAADTVKKAEVEKRGRINLAKGSDHGSR